MKNIGFLSFGHWTPSPQSGTRSASDALLQSIDLAVAAEELGADGAYFRVHHFARQLASPFPLLAAAGAKTKRIELGTAVIDMRYENPLYMIEDAGAADLIAGGRLQLGISRGSPEQVIDGWRYFGYVPQEGKSDADMARTNAEIFLEALERARLRPAQSAADVCQSARTAAAGAAFGRLARPHLVGRGDQRHRDWAAKLGMNLQSSTLKFDESGKPFHVQQAEQIRAYRAAWAEAGHEREPRVSVSRSIFALVNDMDRAYFGRDGDSADQFGYIEANTRAVFGRPICRRAGRADRGIETGRGDRRSRHAALDGAEPAGRRLQRPCDRGDPEARRAGAGVAVGCRGGAEEGRRPGGARLDGSAAPCPPAENGSRD